MTLETQIALGMAGTLLGTIIAILACLWISERRVARQTHVPLIPRCVMRETPTTAYICSWCPDAKDGQPYAERANLMPSHGICPACRTKHFPDLKRV